MNENYDSKKVFFRYAYDFNEYSGKNIFYNHENIECRSILDNRQNIIFNNHRIKNDLSDLNFNYLYDYLNKNHSESLRYLGGNKKEFMKLFAEIIKYIPDENKKSIMYVNKFAQWNYENILRVKKDQMILDKLIQKLKNTTFSPTRGDPTMNYYHMLNEYQTYNNNILYAKARTNKHYNEIQRTKNNNKYIKLYGSLIKDSIKYVGALLAAVGLISVKTVKSQKKYHTVIFSLLVLVNLTVFLQTDKEIVEPTNVEAEKTTKTVNIHITNINNIVNKKYTYIYIYNNYLPAPDQLPIDKTKKIATREIRGDAQLSKFHEYYFSFTSSIDLYSNGEVSLGDKIEVHYNKGYWKSFNLNVSLSSYKANTERTKIIVFYAYTWHGIKITGRPTHGRREGKITFHISPEELNKDAEIKLKKDVQLNFKQ